MKATNRLNDSYNWNLTIFPSEDLKMISLSLSLSFVFLPFFLSTILVPNHSKHCLNRKLCWSRYFIVWPVHIWNRRYFEVVRVKNGLNEWKGAPAQWFILCQDVTKTERVSYDNWKNLTFRAIETKIMVRICSVAWTHFTRSFGRKNNTRYAIIAENKKEWVGS